MWRGVFALVSAGVFWFSCAAAQEQAIDQVEPLLELPGGARVVHGSDPGDFYCEHAFFVSSKEALSPGSSILKNAHGEVLTGFLHLPSDGFTTDGSLVPVQAERHANLRQVVGAAIRGYHEDARPGIGEEPFRMLVTGYGPWDYVVNNPSGDFVTHRENIDAAMEHAFPGAVPGAGGEYRVADPATGRTFAIAIETALLPVTDRAIDGGPDSLQAAIESRKPHAVLSMGVAGNNPFLAEFHADDGGLASENDRFFHLGGRAPASSHPDNFSLARALLRGSTAD